LVHKIIVNWYVVATLAYWHHNITGRELIIHTGLWTDGVE